MKTKLFFLYLLLLTIFFVTQAATKQAVFAGGCFWCMQSDFNKLPGIVKTTVGYDGGTLKNPSYEKVSSGTTQYVESLKVYYNDKKLSYSQLLNYYWQHIDPTVANRQFCDIGKQYRTVIFYLNQQQKKLAEQSLAKLKTIFSNVYTQILPSTHYYLAEKHHQNYYLKNPVRYKFYRWNCGRDQRVKSVWSNKHLS